ncbi:alpha/beta hydrolase [Rhodopila sp.]|uniref:alpha/beta hydrolase n=1 Tax=Rhodopila sp. TaxID=2480087 RepID=UPI003D0D6232
MSDRSRWDPEMAAFTAEQEQAAAAYPAVRAELPLAPHRRVNDLLGLRTAVDGPVMADTADRFVEARGRRIFCRVFRPVTDRVIPTLVYFHGGGWVWANVDTHDRMTREYAAAGPVAVVSVDYALSPEAKFPQALEECAAVVRWVRQHGAEWGLDPTRVFAGGDSAGGNLALATALLLRDTGGPALAGVLANYPVSDARFDTFSYQEFGAGGFGLNTERMAFYWSVYVPHDIDRLHPLAAPLRADLAGLPPVMVLLAELDVLRSEGEALVAKLRAAGVAVETETFAGVVHGFLRATGSVAKARDAVAMAGAWMRRVGEAS